MVDVVDRETRSRMMANIRGRDTKPEMLVRRMLHGAGYRYRLHDRQMPGRPDIVLARHRVAIFVHGCFWHQHPGCHLAYIPRTRRAFWLEKFERNVARDVAAISALEGAGWQVIVVWECVLRSGASQSVLADLVRKIREGVDDEGSDRGSF